LKSAILLISVCAVLFSFQSSPSEEHITDISRRIAEAYGVSSFHTVSKIRYTFNLVRDTTRIARSWIWEPKANRVTFQNLRPPQTQEKPITYIRANPGDSLPGQERSIDKMFINDQYWFLFPFHLVWDSMVTVSVKERQALPIGEGSMTQVTVSYPKSGGYTPGDAFDLFIDKTYHIRQWRYWRGGEKMLMTSAWEHEASAGPVLFSLDRPGGTKNFKVWFTDVAVMVDTAGSWIAAR
jgi:hypothetical protein